MSKDLKKKCFEERFYLLIFKKDFRLKVANLNQGRQKQSCRQDLSTEISTGIMYIQNKLHDFHQLVICFCEIWHKQKIQSTLVMPGVVPVKGGYGGR